MQCLEKKFRVARSWSNAELRRIAALCSGRVVNVSAWKDLDKEGGRYRNYFASASEYWITNYKSSACGFQGDLENELYLDLSRPIAEELKGRFDVVLNHTVLEHVFEIQCAFKNLCDLTRDLVVVVVPFLQEQHAEYGDYWRFTPQALDKLFEKNGLTCIYASFNDDEDASIYVVAVGSKRPDLWSGIAALSGNRIGSLYRSDSFAGTRVIRNGVRFRMMNRIRGWLGYRGTTNDE